MEPFLSAPFSYGAFFNNGAFFNDGAFSNNGVISKGTFLPMEPFIMEPLLTMEPLLMEPFLRSIFSCRFGLRSRGSAKRHFDGSTTSQLFARDVPARDEMPAVKIGQAVDFINELKVGNLFKKGEFSNNGAISSMEQ